MFDVSICAALALAVVTVMYLYSLLRQTGSTGGENSLDAFIIQDDSGSKAANHDKKTDKYKHDYTSEGRQVLIMYGTEYGCSEEVGKQLYDRIRAMPSDADKPPLQPRLVNAKHFNVVDLSREQVCFIVISTSGDGVPPTDARAFYDHVMTSDLDLSHLRFSVLALGDSNYPLFCKTGRTLYQRLLDLNCTSVLDLHQVDMEDWSVIGQWLEGVLGYLETARLQPSLDYIQHGDMEDEKYSRHRPFMATLKVRQLLTVCSADDDKETIHCELDIGGSDLTWTSGDALGVFPQNNPSEVARLVTAVKVDGSLMVEPPSWAYQEEDGKISITVSLQKYYDIKTVKADLLEALRSNVKDETDTVRLEILLKDGVSSSNEVLIKYIKNVEVADVLLEFRSHTLPWQQVLKCMKSLQPRYYSISSSPKISQTCVCVTAAVVRYNMAGYPRTGVTTTFLQDRLPVGDKCPVFMSRNPDFRLPSNSQVPVILIGPGTGIAPFMAFIQERELEKEVGQTWLYFGCRHRDKDFLYRKQLEIWHDEGVIRLSVAFSRDQKEKVYVQHLLTRDQQQIWDLLSKGGCIYVCGDAKHMAHDVHHALIDIVKGQGHMDEAQALTYLQTLENEERYQKDVWVV